MNRKQRRQYSNTNSNRGLRKKHTKGASGSLPIYLQEFRRKAFEKEAQKYIKTIENQNNEVVETKEVTADNPSM